MTDVPALIATGQQMAKDGDSEQAREAFTQALRLDPNSGQAHLGLARLNMPGQPYFDCLGQLHELLAPARYLEIGVAGGKTLAMARPPTIAIGVDPDPHPDVTFRAETHIYPLPSDEFFEGGHAEKILDGQPPNMAFIDGLHVFEQALRDFMNVERLSHRETVVMFHDTLPLDEPTQMRERQTQFWTGDVWKVVACLMDERPDLEIFTIAAAPSGLAVIRGLDPASDSLQRDYDRIVATYAPLGFEEHERRWAPRRELVPSERSAIVERFERH